MLDSKAAGQPSRRPTAKASVPISLRPASAGRKRRIRQRPGCLGSSVSVPIDHPGAPSMGVPSNAWMPGNGPAFDDGPSALAVTEPATGHERRRSDGTIAQSESAPSTSGRSGNRIRVPRRPSTRHESASSGMGCSRGSNPPAMEKARKPLTTDGDDETRWTDLKPSPKRPVVEDGEESPGASPGLPLRFMSIMK